ncbi:MAG: hypothetical protein LBK67_06505 [Coriobacteriales bacterium]|jgi:hypothetical protein|nr:hypothetical protein [Coriobacteriales bacterium]
MRRPRFDRWARRLILELAKTESFNLRRLAASAQKDNPRLVEPLFLFAYDTDNTDRLFELLWKDEVRASYETALEALAGRSLTDIALHGCAAEELPREYCKILNSFRAAYYRPETIYESKRLRWERSRRLQLEKGVRASEVYHALGLNPGNVNAYLKHGELDKVSLENATNIMKYLYQ